MVGAKGKGLLTGGTGDAGWVAGWATLRARLRTGSGTIWDAPLKRALALPDRRAGTWLP